MRGPFHSKRRAGAGRTFGLALLLLSGWGGAVLADDPTAPGGWSHVELRRFPAKEAKQGVAVDADHFYAIDNREIGKYRKDTGDRVGGWLGEKDGPIRHLNAGRVIDGKLYCAHSNFPTIPEQSSVEIWDVATMNPAGRHIFEKPPGSLTWVDRLGDDWIACFAHYRKTGDPANSRVLRFDAGWKPLTRWAFPAPLLERFGAYSSSGGSFGPGGFLFVTGHDARELYLLDPPGEGTELRWRATVPITAAGQAFAWDPVEARVFYAIDRKAREVIVARITQAKP